MVRTTACFSSVCALLAWSAIALAQSPSQVECRTTETQPECHTRLKCTASEELEDCQKRLLKCTANEPLADCQKRVGAKPANQGAAGPRDDAATRGNDRDAADRRDRDDDEDRGNRRDRDNADNRGDRRDRSDRDRGRNDGDRRRQRGSDRRRGEGGGEGGFQANKTFGLGLEVGAPTGLNGKYFLSDSGALDFGVGLIYSHYYYGDGIHLYGDYLWHPTSLVSASAFELPFYIGVGLRYWDFEYCDRGVCGLGGSAIGIRVPVGISFDFNNAPLDIFLQLVPVIDFISGDYYDRFDDRNHFGIDLSAGIRYWFN